MKVLRHIVALMICAAVAVAVVMLYEHLNPFTPTETPLWSGASVEELEYDRTLLVLWFAAFCAFCLGWFLWNQRFSND